jgi:DNA-binding GntR family transcriptional regulator
MTSLMPSAGAAPLPRSTVRETTLRAVREMIISGQLTVGQPLRQDELAAQLGISRTPLREALQTLATEGLVRIEVHRGAVVAQPSVQQLLDTYQIREALEVVAGREAAGRSTREHADGVARILAELSSERTPDRWTELNARFHAAIYAIVPNAQLLELIEMLRNRAELYIRILAGQDGPARQADGSHEQMLAALRRNDPDAMESLIRGHLHATTDAVAPLLRPAEPANGAGASSETAGR